METLKQLVAQGLLRNAIDQALEIVSNGSTLSNDFILLSGRLASLDRQKFLGIINYADENQERARITNAFLSLITTIDGNEEQSIRANISNSIISPQYQQNRSQLPYWA